MREFDFERGRIGLGGAEKGPGLGIKGVKGVSGQGLGYTMASYFFLFFLFPGALEFLWVLWLFFLMIRRKGLEICKRFFFF